MLSIADFKHIAAVNGVIAKGNISRRLHRIQTDFALEPLLKLLTCQLPAMR
jgi:hypothetical protein